MSSSPHASRFAAKPALERFLLQLPSDEGADFFDTLTEAIGRATGVTHVVVAEPTEQPPVRARTLSVWAHGARVDDFAYDLGGSPCAELYTGRLVCYPERVRHRFPGFDLLRELGVEGYWGTGMPDSNGTLLGHLALLHTGKLSLDDDLERQLRMLAVRVGQHLERRRMSGLLDEQDRRLRETLEHVPGVLYQFQVEPDGTVAFTYASPRFRDVIGVDINEALADFERAFNVIHPDDRARCRQAMREAAAGGGAFDWIGRHLVGDAIRYLRWRSLPTRLENGTVRWAGYLTDETELRRTELELQAVKDRHLAAQRAAGIGNWELDPHTRRLAWSDNQYELYGIDPAAGPPTLDDVLGMTTVADRARMQERLNRMLHARKPFEFEWCVTRPDGRLCHIQCRGTPIFDEHGKIHLITGTDLDVTREVAAREALRESEEKLRHAQKMDAIGQLAGGVAHDFNNLLTAMLGFSQLALQKMEANEDARGELGEVVKSVERARELTTKLVTIARRQVLKIQPVDVGRVVRDMEPVLWRTLGEDVELSVQLEALTGCIRADVSSLEQVILNLAVNARDAMPAGGELRIDVRQVHRRDVAQAPAGEPDDALLALTVTDTGCGMTREQLSRIFEPFYTTKPKGTGLGLATVYGVVDRFGGFVTVQSAPGAGSTFGLHFPFDPDARPGESEPVRDHVRGGSETILVVEDDHAVRRFVVQSLESLGYRVLSASNGSEALDMLGGAPDVALLISDVVMPHMSGPTLVALALALRPGLRCLYITGFSPDRAVGDQAGTHGVLLKPFTFEELAATAREALDAQS